MTPTDVVRAMFTAYVDQDRGSAERLLHPDFRFTSPQDDHIDRAAFLERCFPTADRFSRQELLHVAEADERDVFVMYEYELRTGGTHRNTEVLTVDGDQVRESQVFFGGSY